MTIAARLCVLAGVIAITAMVAADASAQDCPEWLKWACPDSASSNPAARKGDRRGKQMSGTKATSSSEIGRRTKQARGGAANTTTDLDPQQTRPAEPARPARAARHIGNNNPSGDRRQASRHGEREGKRLDPVLNDYEKEVLFQEFLKWDEKPRLNVETNR